VASSDAFRRGVGLQVAAKRCNECLYSSSKIVPDDRRASLLADCRKSGRYFICHKATIRGDAVVCRAFFDTEPNQACQVAERLGIVRFVDAETGEAANA
jgi:hypothetical protein